jgi:hypothetical protein
MDDPGPDELKKFHPLSSDDIDLGAGGMIDPSEKQKLASGLR